MICNNSLWKSVPGIGTGPGRPVWSPEFGAGLARTAASKEPSMDWLGFLNHKFISSQNMSLENFRQKQAKYFDLKILRQNQAKYFGLIIFWAKQSQIFWPKNFWAKASKIFWLENFLIKRKPNILTFKSILKIHQVSNRLGKPSQKCRHLLNTVCIWIKFAIKPYGKAVDWWAFGVLIFEMCQGCPPFFERESERRSLEDKILQGHFHMPHSFSLSLKNLLLSRESAEMPSSGLLSNDITL